MLIGQFAPEESEMIFYRLQLVAAGHPDTHPVAKDDILNDARRDSKRANFHEKNTVLLFKRILIIDRHGYT